METKDTEIYLILFLSFCLALMYGLYILPEDASNKHAILVHFKANMIFLVCSHYMWIMLFLLHNQEYLNCAVLIVVPLVISMAAIDVDSVATKRNATTQGDIPL